MAQGILYKITNLITGCCYIGSTLHEKPRLARHKRHLRKGKHVNKMMQEDFLLYGEDNFLFEVIQRNIPEEDLPLEESIAILIEQEDKEHLVYNISRASRISPSARQKTLQKNLLRRQFFYNRLLVDPNGK